MLDQPELGDHLAPSSPIAVNGTHHPATPAPGLGANTVEILRDHLGLTDDAIAELRTAGTIVTDPTSS